MSLTYEACELASAKGGIILCPEQGELGSVMIDSQTEVLRCEWF
jgi:hypothetical protein